MDYATHYQNEEKAVNATLTEIAQETEHELEIFCPQIALLQNQAEGMYAEMYNDQRAIFEEIYQSVTSNVRRNVHYRMPTAELCYTEPINSIFHRGKTRLQEKLYHNCISSSAMSSILCCAYLWHKWPSSGTLLSRMNSTLLIWNSNRRCKYHCIIMISHNSMYQQNIMQLHSKISSFLE